MSNNEIAVTYKVGEEEIRLTPAIVTNYLTGGAQITNPEFKMFAALCKSRGLNPFLKEAYIIKFGNLPAQIVVGKDAILKRAILNPDFDGREQGIIVIDVNGETVERNGTFFGQDETLVGGWAKAYRKNWKFPVYVTVSFAESAQKKKDGSLNKQWATKGATMIEKVALVRALREAFVEDAGGMYDADELPAQEREVIIENQVIEQEEPVIDNVEVMPENDDSGVIDINDL